MNKKYQIMLVLLALDVACEKEIILPLDSIDNIVVSSKNTSWMSWNYVVTAIFKTDKSDDTLSNKWYRDTIRRIESLMEQLEALHG